KKLRRRSSHIVGLEVLEDRTYPGDVIGLPGLPWWGLGLGMLAAPRPGHDVRAVAQADVAPRPEWRERLPVSPSQARFETARQITSSASPVAPVQGDTSPQSWIVASSGEHNLLASTLDADPLAASDAFGDSAKVKAPHRSVETDGGESGSI